MPYTVEVQTGNRENAGTDANVFVQFRGGNGTSTELRLDNEQDNFERGKLDSFSVGGPSVGWIDSIRIFHDNSGKKAGWFLGSVKATDPDLGLTWQADFNRWLATDEGDGSIDVTAEIPIGGVSLNQGVLKRLYMGYACARRDNQSSQQIEWNDSFTYQYKKGVSVSLESAISVKTSVKLGASFFGVSAEFGAEVAGSVARKQGTSEEETLEWKSAFTASLPPGQAITAVAIYYQDVLLGKAEVSGVRLDFEQKFNVSEDIIFFDGYLADAQIQERIRQLIQDATSVGLPASLPRVGARVPLLEKALEQVTATAVKAGRDEWAKHMVQPSHVQRYPRAKLFIPMAGPHIRRIIG